ncbi:MAG: DMT family transporter [Lewinellaceae bacterium]|nr:DMT family transporter [Phaeodactylibacter sp.]MCB9347515.1 DMT family transporter [Lewinellaceae bacterium]
MATINRPLFGHLLLLTVAFIYGSLFVVGKIILVELPADSLTLFRIAVAFVLFTCMGRMYVREHMQPRHIGAVVLAGAVGIAGSLSAFSKGLALSSAISSTLVMASTPVWVALGGAVLLGEVLTRQRIIGIGLCTAGLAILLTQGRVHEINLKEQGLLWVLLAAMAYALFILLVKPLTAHYEPNTILTRVFGVGLLCLLPFCTIDLNITPFASLSMYSWLGLLFVGIVATFGVHLLNAHALRMLPANVVGSYLYLHPVAATILAYGIGLETIESSQVGAASLVLLGVFISNTGRPASTHVDSTLNQNSITIKNKQHA